MYNETKLEKGLYHLANKSFLQALEEADPDAQYAGTPLGKLDAYERQLKRFDIRVSGPLCDRVEKFFTTTESAVLFPEFVRRAVMQGIEDSVLGDITAVVSRSESNMYQGIDLTDTADYSTTAAGTEMPASSIGECTEAITLTKYGRLVKATYEAVRQQRLDVFALMLRRVGKCLADAMLSAALNVLKTGATSVTTAASTLTYGDVAGLYGSFKSFSLQAVLASPAVIAQILAMTQMEHTSAADAKDLRLPFGARLICCPQLDDKTVLGLDTDFALEQIQSSDVVLETDKLIDRQLDCIGISVNIGFRRLMKDAVQVVNIHA